MQLSTHEIEAKARDMFGASHGEPNRTLSNRDKLRFGRKGSLVVDLTGDYAGAWHSFESGESGWVDKEKLDGALFGHRLPSRRSPKRYAPEQQKTERVSRILSQSRSPARTPVEIYLESRGIYCPLPHSIRYCENPRGMVGVFQNPIGDVTAVQVTYLTIAGYKQAREVQKQTFSTGPGWHRNAAIRIPGRGELVLCEGIETALSIHQVSGRPVWACTSASILGAIWVKKKRVTIAHDGDEEGSEADEVYQKTITKLLKQGKRVKSAKPPVGKDFNDVLNTMGEGAVHDMISGAQLCQR